MQEPASTTEAHVAFAGDWHANAAWVRIALERLHRQFPQVRTVLHAGDFGLFPGRHPAGYLNAVDEACRQYGIRDILVTPGNHEDWSALNSAFAEHPGRPVQCSEFVWVLPRGYRFVIGGRSILSFGGAASVDYEYRVSGVSWWEAEIPSPEDVLNAVEGGPVDILITHDAVDGGTPRVELARVTNPQGWPTDALAYSAMSRARVTEVWKAVAPAVLVHGHMHLNAEAELPDGRRVISLGRDETPGNMGVLDLRTLDWLWVAEPNPGSVIRCP